jgi:hypothetical protein
VVWGLLALLLVVVWAAQNFVMFLGLIDMASVPQRRSSLLQLSVASAFRLQTVQPTVVVRSTLHYLCPGRCCSSLFLGPAVRGLKVVLVPFPCQVWAGHPQSAAHSARLIPFQLSVRTGR